MTEYQIRQAYMNAHIRLNGKTPPEEWSEEQRVCAFAMLKAPDVTMDVFKARLNIDTEASTPDELTEEEKQRINEESLKAYESRIEG